MHRSEPQRGGCLTFFLIAILIANGYSALISAGKPLILALAIARIVFAIAIWSWQRWGAYGYGVVSVFLAAAALMTGDISTTVGVMVDLGILAVLLRDPWPLME